MQSSTTTAVQTCTPGAEIIHNNIYLILLSLYQWLSINCHIYNIYIYVCIFIFESVQVPIVLMNTENTNSIIIIYVESIDSMAVFYKWMININDRCSLSHHSVHRNMWSYSHLVWLEKVSNQCVLIIICNLNIRDTLQIIQFTHSHTVTLTVANFGSEAMWE